MSNCPNGHNSEWDDYCSVCGDAMNASGGSGPDKQETKEAPDAAKPTSPSAGQGSCPNCADPHEVGDVFCETCGYDFATGSLPGAALTSGATSASPAAPIEGSEFVAVVGTDREYFASAVDSTQLAFPDPAPEDVRIPLTSSKILIGRHSQSRGIYPEIDLAAITEDPAVSGRHAMMHRSDDNAWTISDLGSTNGTTVNDQSLSAGVELPLELGVPIYLGAWTRITIENS